MKLRLQSNSIRLRLKRDEVAQLAQSGRVEEEIIIGSGPKDTFHYVVESSQGMTAPYARLLERGILVQFPSDVVSRWAAGEEVGMEAVMLVGDQRQLHVLVEKDFACLNGTEEQNLDTFPNPLAGTKC